MKLSTDRISDHFSNMLDILDLVFIGIVLLLSVISCLEPSCWLFYFKPSVLCRCLCFSANLCFPREQSVVSSPVSVPMVSSHSSLNLITTFLTVLICPTHFHLPILLLSLRMYSLMEAKSEMLSTCSSLLLPL